MIAMIGIIGMTGPGAGVRCGACESHEVTVDEVEHDGWLWIAECRHCDHRWTKRVEPAVAEASRPVVRVQRVSRAGVATAA